MPLSGFSLQMSHYEKKEIIYEYCEDPDQPTHIAYSNHGLLCSLNHTFIYFILFLCVHCLMRVTQLITITNLPCALYKTLKYSNSTVCNDTVGAQQNTLIRLSIRARKDPFSEGMQNRMWTVFNAVARTELFLRKLPKNLIKIFLKSLTKKGLLLKERICSLWEQILSFKSSPYGKEAKYLMLMSLYCKYFPLHVTHIRNVRHMRNCVMSLRLWSCFPRKCITSPSNI